jgi:hypothetical protein
MARTVTEIKAQMTAEWMDSPVVAEKYGLEPGNTFESRFSSVSLESLFFYVVAFGLWVLESLFDVHKSEVAALIAKMKPHSAQWYAEKARAYQDGFDLLADGSGFDNAGHSESDIEASRIVKYSAAIEKQNGLQIKAAKVGGGDLAALDPEEQARFTWYINKIKDAGVHIDILTAEAQLLKLSLAIYYNPLVLTSAGHRVDGTGDNVVKEAIKSYLSSIEFDGTLVVAHLTDALQQIEGVSIPHINTGNPAPDYGIAYRYGELDWIPIEVMHRPDSGYIRLDEDALTINYIPR